MGANLRSVNKGVRLSMQVYSKQGIIYHVWYLVLYYGQQYMIDYVTWVTYSNIGLYLNNL